MTNARKSFDDKFGEPPPIASFIMDWAVYRLKYLQGWTDALSTLLLKIPGGEVCDPQVIADEIRELMK